MKTYRVEVPATVGFEVFAATEADAVELAKQLVQREGGEATHIEVISPLIRGQMARNQAVYLNLEDLDRDISLTEEDV